MMISVMVRPARILATLGAFAFLIAACAPRATEPGTTSETPAMSHNTLTADEQAAGWRSLFNGADFSGWRAFKKPGEPVGDPWAIEDGTITLVKNGMGVDLITEDQFEDFELTLDWKISENGNSGIMYYVNELPDTDYPWETGPEMQVLDNERHYDKETPSHRAGALYDLIVPSAEAVKPAGEWNSVRIVSNDGKIEHWLNGQKVVETSYGDDAWKALVAKSKFKDMPHFGTFTKGGIVLQDHGDRVWYRNIKIRAL